MNNRINLRSCLLKPGFIYPKDHIETQTSKVKSTNQKSCQLLAIFAYFIWTVCQEANPFHPNMRQSDILGGWQFQNHYLDSCFQLFLLHEQVPHGPQFYPLKFCILNQNIQYPTPRNQENIGPVVLFTPFQNTRFYGVKQGSMGYLFMKE